MTLDISQHPTLLYADEIKAIGAPLRALNIDYFSRARVSKDGKISGLGSDAEFMKIYLSKAYYNCSLHREREHFGNVILWDAPAHFGKSLELHELKQSLKLFNGFTIVNKAEKYWDYYHFASHIQNPALLNTFFSHLDWLHLFSKYFDEKIHENKTLQKSFEFTFDLEPQEIKLPLSCDPLAPLVELFSGKKFKIYYQNKIFYLSQRELQILHWLSAGKASEAISLILEISKSTVDKHIENIKSKSECYTLFQLGILFAEIKSHPLINRLGFNTASAKIQY